MKNRFFRLFLSGALAISIVFGGGLCSLSKAGRSGFTVNAQAAVTTLGIDKTSLSVGNTILVSNADGYSLVRYFIGDVEVGSDHILSSDDYEKWIRVEGFEDADGEPVATDRAYFSNLPVIYINTDDGAPIDSKSTYVSGQMDIQNNTGSDLAYSGAVEIKGRGNSTWEWPKKPYKIKLDKKTDFFGKGKNKHYVLLANYLDESLLRNTTGFKIAEKLGLPTMQSVWTDVVLNGEYVGNYQLCEQIRVGADRVDIFDWENTAEDVASEIYAVEKKKITKDKKGAFEDHVKEDLSWVTTGVVSFEGQNYTVSSYYPAFSDLDISGGYLFEMSDQYDEESKFTTDRGLKVMLQAPEFLRTNDEMMAYVENYWQDLEDAYCSEDGYTVTESGKKHYSELADIDSMVSYWLTMEIMGNNDAWRRSRFAYLDVNGIMKYGPAWDFDWGAGSSMVGDEYANWKVSATDSDQAFFKEFTDDPLFISKATEKYWKIRPFLQSLVEDGGYLDAQTANLQASGAADELRWDRHETWPDAARGFQQDATMFKSYLANRLSWLDKQFKTDDALLNSLHTSLSSSPYEKSEQITISVDGGSEDTVSAHAPADFTVEQGNGVGITVRVSDGATEKLNVYVNGLEHGSVDVEGGQAVIELPESILDAGTGKKNVISVIGKDAADNTTGRNFVTVILTEATKPVFKGNNILLDGKIGVNFFVDLSPLTEEEKAACYVEFMVSGQTTTDVFDEECLNVTGEYYGFTCYVNSVQMAERITAVLHYGDGQTISKSFSVAEYIDIIDEQPEKYDEETLALVHALADYGHYVQYFCAAHNGWTVGDRFADMDKHYAENYDYSAIKALIADKAAVLSVDGSDIEKVTFSLYPDADTSIKIFLKPVSGYEGSVTVDGFEAELQADGRYCVVIPNIPAHKLGKTFDIEIVTESGTATVQVSAMSYVYAILNSEVYADNQIAKDAVSSIYKYYEAAMAYKEAKG